MSRLSNDPEVIAEAAALIGAQELSDGIADDLAEDNDFITAVAAAVVASLGLDVPQPVATEDLSDASALSAALITAGVIVEDDS